jgi:hypothetical protein
MTNCYNSNSQKNKNKPKNKNKNKPKSSRRREVTKIWAEINEIETKKKKTYKESMIQKADSLKR